MRARQKVSRAGVELIKSFEGLRSTAARLPDGRWTLGYGHTFSAREGARVTQEDADALLRFDLLPIVDAINNAILVPINQNQFDALVSFCFNIGVDNFAQSSVLKCINEGRMTEAALAMDSWRSAEFNGQTYVLAPLIRRRAAEKNLFLTPEESAGNAPSLLVRPTLDTAPVADARPSELNAPDRGGVLSAYPMGQPGLSPYAQPIPQAPQITPPPAPAPERQVIDLGSFTPRAVEMPLSPYANPVRSAPETVVESLPDGFVPSAVRPVPAPDAEPQMSPAVQAALARAQEEQRLREDAGRQAAAFAAQQELAREQDRQDRERIERLRAEQVRLDQEAYERGRQERERIERERLAREGAETAARLEQARLEQERLERERAEQARLDQEARDRAQREQEERDRAEAARLEQARLEQARLEQERIASEAAAQATAPSSDDAEKARKAEAAAALMRLYSPYGGGALGRPLAAVPAPQPVAAPAPDVVATPAPAFMPYTPQPVAQEFTNQSVIAPASAESAPIEATAPVVEAVPEPVVTPEPVVEESNVVDFTPVASPRTMPPPTITALNPYGLRTAQPEPAPVEANVVPDVVEVPRPQAVDLSATPTFAPQPAPAEPVHWREQLQRPLPENYQTPDAGEQASLINPPASHFESLYHDDNEEWTMDGGRIAVASEDHDHDHPSVWNMILNTFWMLFISAIGLGCLGVAAAAFTKSHDPNVIRNGFLSDYTNLSLLFAVFGILFVSISVWLIMKRLGGLKD